MGIQEWECGSKEFGKQDSKLTQHYGTAGGRNEHLGTYE